MERIWNMGRLSLEQMAGQFFDTFDGFESEFAAWVC